MKPTKLGIIEGHVGGLSAFALSPDGKTLVSAGLDLQVKLWDVGTQEERATLRRADAPHLPEKQLSAHQGAVHALAFSPDGKTLASGAGGVLRKTAEGKPQLLGEVKLWDVAAGKEKTVISILSAFIYAVAFSPDGKTLAGAGGIQPTDTTQYWDFKDIPKEHLEFKEFGEVKVWDVVTLKERTFFRREAGRVMSVAFSPDGKTLASGGRDGAIRLWDVTTGRERARLRESTSYVRSARFVRAVAFSPDGKTLASVQADPDDPVSLWDLASGRVRARLKGHAGWVNAVAFSPDGRVLATAGNVHPDNPGRYDATGEVRLWDASTGRPLGAPLTFLHHGSSVAFGARGKVLAAGGTRGIQRSLGVSRLGAITLWALGPRGATAP